MPSPDIFRETLVDGLVRLDADISTTREETGRNFSTHGYFLNVMVATGKGQLEALNRGAANIYPFPKEGYPGYLSQEAQTAIRGMLLAAQTIRLIRPTDYHPMMEGMARRLDAHTDHPRRPSGAHQLEALGHSVMDQYALNLESVNSYHSMVHDPRELPRLRSVFGFGVSVFEEISTLGSATGLQTEADALASLEGLDTSQIDWLQQQP